MRCQNKDLKLQYKCISSFSLPFRRHTANEVRQIIGRVVRERPNKRTPDYFLSDSARVNPAAVRKFMQNDGGDDYWFPCSIHFMQLAMRDAVLQFLNRSVSSPTDDSNQNDIEWDEVTRNLMCLLVQSLL